MDPAVCIHCALTAAPFSLWRYLGGDLLAVPLQQPAGSEAGRPTRARSCGINRFLLAIPGTVMQGRLFFFPLLLSIHILRREMGECGGWRAGGGIPSEPPHDTAAFSVCVNKPSLNYLIILCKLRDQGTYWKAASKPVQSVSLAQVFKSSSPTSTWSYSKQKWTIILMMSRIKKKGVWILLFWALDFYWAPLKKKKKSLFITKECSLYLLVA